MQDKRLQKNAAAGGSKHYSGTTKDLVNAQTSLQAGRWALTLGQSQLALSAPCVPSTIWVQPQLSTGDRDRAALSRIVLAADVQFVQTWLGSGTTVTRTTSSLWRIVAVSLEALRSFFGRAAADSALQLQTLDHIILWLSWAFPHTQMRNRVRVEAMMR